MKKFFKKIAFVSAMATVVSTMPAQSAAAAEGPQMSKWVGFYLGGDASGTYSDEAKYAKVWNWKDDYVSVSFESSNPEVATVTAKKGKITPLSVGTTTITATFTDEDGETVDKTCKVTVKRNADIVGIHEDSAEKLKNLVVGDTYQTKVFKSSADGETVTWKGKSVFTDGVRFKSSNPDVFTVTSTTGKVTAVGAGEAELTMWAVQTEKPVVDEATGKSVYRPTTDVVKYDVKVVSAFDAQQSAHNAFNLIFPTAEEAKVAKDATLPSLTNADAAVSESKDIIKVYKVLANSKNNEVAVFIGGISANENVVSVTMFDEFDQETEYVVRYQDKEVRFTTIKNVASSMAVVLDEHKSVAEDASYSTVKYQLFADGPDGQKVDITNCKKYIGWQDTVKLEDVNANQYHAEYTFDAANKRIDFYTSNQNYTVTLKATFEDWYNVDTTTTLANTISAIGFFTPGDNSFEIGQVERWAVVTSDKIAATEWSDYSNKAFAADDDDYALIIEASIKENGTWKKVYSDGTNSDSFTFKSSNDDKLIVDEETGALYPPKQPTNGKVNIYVYYDGQYIGLCDVTVYAERVFSYFTAELSSTKLSYNADDTDVQDVINVTFKPQDQLFTKYDNADMTYSFEIYATDTVKSYFVTSADVAGRTSDGYPYFTIEADTTLPTDKITNIRLLCTATYDNGVEQKIERKYSLTLAAKNTTGGVAKSYDLVASKNAMDMILDGTDDNAIDTKAIKLSAYSYDKDQFKINHLALTPATAVPTDNSLYTVVLQLGSEFIPLTSDGKDAVFTLVTKDNTKKFANAEGTINEVTNAIEKVEEGNYTARLYVPGTNNKPVFKVSEMIKVTDTQPKVQFVWMKYSTAEADPMLAITDCIDFWYQNAWNIVDDQVYVGYVVDDAVVYDNDYVVKNDRLTIKQVRCLIEVDEGVYEQVISVMRSVNTGVTE